MRYYYEEEFGCKRVKWITPLGLFSAWWMDPVSSGFVYKSMLFIYIIWNRRYLYLIWFSRQDIYKLFREFMWFFKWDTLYIFVEQCAGATLVLFKDVSFFEIFSRSHRSGRASLMIGGFTYLLPQRPFIWELIRREIGWLGYKLWSQLGAYFHLDHWMTASRLYPMIYLYQPKGLKNAYLKRVWTRTL